MGNWFSEVLVKMGEIKWYTWAVVAILVTMFFVLTTANKRTKWNSRRIAGAAMCIAISFVLSYIRLFRMPQGGSVTLMSMFPIILFSVACGPAQGLLVGCAYGLLQLLQDMYVIHPMQMLLDYPLAFGALALGGLAIYLPIPERAKLPVAMVVGVVGRLIMSTLSGVIFFAEYAPEGQPVLLYSLGYNGSFMAMEALLCAILALLPGMPRLLAMLRGEARM